MTPKSKTLRVYLATNLVLHLAALLLCVAYYLYQPGPAGIARAVGLTAAGIVIGGRILLYWFALADLSNSALLVRVLSWSSFLAALLSACFIGGRESVYSIQVGETLVSMTVVFTVLAVAGLIDAILTRVILNSAEKK